MNMSIKEINPPNYQTAPVVTLPDTSEVAKDPIQALLDSLQEGENVSNQELVNNLIALLKSVQSLLLSLQEGQSKKSGIDADVQKTLMAMNEAKADAMQKELDEYLKALAEYEKNKLINDIFGAILPFLTLIFPPLLALYPMGPMSLLLDPNAPFDMGVLGKEIEEKHGKGALMGITIGLEVTATIVMTVLTCGAGAAVKAASKVGGEALKLAIKQLMKAVVKDLALYGAAKALTSDEVLPHIINGVIKMAEGMSGKELSDEEKAAIKVIVTLIIQIVLMVAAFKCGSGSSSKSLAGFFNSSAKMQKASIAVLLVIQGAQSGLQMWSGMNTIETAKIQKNMKEIEAMGMLLKGMDAAQKTNPQNAIKELQRYFATIEPRELDLEKVAGQPGSKAAQIMSK